MTHQRTLASEIQTTGIGLHTGAKVRLRLRPAPPNSGIVFRRTDLTPPVDIPVRPEYVRDTRLSSSLEYLGAKVSTVEHLMAALAGFGVDNLIVELDAPEVPIMDGSSAAFVFLLRSAGISEQSAPKRYVRITKPVEVRDGDKWVRLSPHTGFLIDFTIAFDHPAFSEETQRLTLDLARASFVRNLARARTFGFMHEVETLRTHGLALGGSMDNAIVLDDYRVLNRDGLRFANEFVQHKVLDAVGDLAILGHPLIGAFTAYKSGHKLNNQLLRALLDDATAWEYVSFSAPPARPSQAALAYSGDDPDFLWQC